MIDAGRGGPSDAPITNPTDGGRAAPSADMSTFGLNGPSKCAGSNFAICENFESTALGAIPAGWTKEGTWATVASADDKARGNQSLRIAVGTANNERGFLLKTAAQLGALATQHYGRMFFKLQNPPTLFIHWDFFHGIGTWMPGITHDVRWGFTGTRTFTYLYNVQPAGTNAPGEFGDNATNSLVTNQWICVEWILDSTAPNGGAAHLWIDGTSVARWTSARGPELARTEIPVFTRYGVGWELFNATDTPSVAFIDEVVFDSQRIGCNN